MEILILCGIYLVELACYLLTLRTLFEVQRKSSIWMVAGLFLTVVIGVLPMNDVAGKNILILIVVVSMMFMTIEGSILEKILRLVLSLLLLECMDSIFSHPCNMLLGEYTKYVENSDFLLIKSCSVLCLFLLNSAKEKIRKFKKVHINTGIYFIIGAIAVSMVFCLNVVNFVIDYLPYDRYVIFCNVLSIAVCISIFLLVIFVIYIKNTHEQMEELLKTEQLLKESQVNYYKQILKKEVDTRKYRHDMINHLVYVQSILSKNKLKDAQKYLESMLGKFKVIQNTYYIVGNEMVETIMNYYFGMLPNRIKIEIKGMCLVDIDMEDTDVCTVFSNLFQNAVEEILENNINDARIIVEVRKGNQYVEYSIINSMFSEINREFIGKNNLPISHKVDKKNHGIGMINVKNTVERNGGTFKWEQKEGHFIVNVVLPIRY